MTYLNAHVTVVQQCAEQHAGNVPVLVAQLRRTMTNPAVHYAIGSPNDPPEVAYARFQKGQEGWADFVHPHVLGAALIKLHADAGEPVPEYLYVAQGGEWVPLSRFATVTSTQTPAEVQSNAAQAAQVAAGNAQSGASGTPAQDVHHGSGAAAAAQTSETSAALSQDAQTAASSDPASGLDGDRLPALTFEAPGYHGAGRPAKSPFDAANDPKVPKGAPPRLIRDYNEMAARLFSDTHYALIGKTTGSPQRLRAWGPLIDLVQSALGSAHPDLTVRELREYLAKSLAAASEAAAWPEIQAWREYARRASDDA